MLRVGVLLCVIAVAVGGPPVSRSREDIEAFKSFLEKGRTDDGIILSDRMTDNPKAKEWENSGKYQGDILLDDWQVQAMVESFAAGRTAYIFPNTRWPDNTVVYEFGEGEFGPLQTEAILEGMRDIEAHTCVKFRERQPGEFNFVRITGGPGGCYANVGFWATRGVHTFNVARNTPGLGCFRHTTIIHEWLHIIGFFHTQSTYNRDEYVEIMWANIQPGMEHNFEKYTEEMVSNLGLPYDYASCMHYGAYGFSINGFPTIVALQDFDGVMGQQEFVTDWDWLRVNRHYDCPGAWDDVSNSRSVEVVKAVDQA